MAVSFVALLGRRLQMAARSQSETRHFTLDKGCRLQHSVRVAVELPEVELASYCPGVPNRVRGHSNTLVFPPGTANADQSCVLSGGAEDRPHTRYLLRRYCCEMNSPNLTFKSPCKSVRRHHRVLSAFVLR